MSLFYRTPARMEDLALFTRHLAGAAAARAPLPELLRAYALEAEPGPMTKALGKIAEQVEQGIPLADALDLYPKLFPSAYRRLVRLGEQGRSLAGVMNQLADGMEESLRTYEYFRAAAIYPLVVMCLLMADVGFILVKIVPRFTAIFVDLGASLPAPTQLLVTASNDYGLAIFGSLCLLIIGFLLAASMGLRMRSFGYGRAWLSVPLIGPVLRRAETARFAQNLSLMLANRIPLAESLGLLAESTENSYVRGVIEEFRDRIESGDRLSDLLAGHTLFPPTMAVMMSRAEDQGGLVETMRALGRFYEARTSHGLTILREIFQPLMLLLIGLLVGFIVISLYLPLFDLPRHVGN